MSEASLRNFFVLDVCFGINGCVLLSLIVLVEGL